jgi:hypothetical protein
MVAAEFKFKLCHGNRQNTKKEISLDRNNYLAPSEFRDVSGGRGKINLEGD